MAAATSATSPPRDPNTLSNYNCWKSTHVTANLEILFDQQKLVGNVVHRLVSRTQAESTEILLDTSYLEISGVEVDGKASAWKLLPAMAPYGSALKIELDNGVQLGSVINVDVRFDAELDNAHLL